VGDTTFLERVTPDSSPYALWQEHINRYNFALSYVSHKMVLDVACGTGYGTESMSKNADLVVGVDVSRDALKYAMTHYGKTQNTEFVLADACNLPFQDNTFDAVVSFETIEHLIHPSFFLQEIRKILKVDGKLIVSTPNRKISPSKGKPANPFHKNEFYDYEFSKLLDIFSPKMQFYGQCSYTLKDQVLHTFDRRLPASFKVPFKKLKKPPLNPSMPHPNNLETIDAVYGVKKIRDFRAICFPFFFIVVVDNKKL
jgi:O-antigen biosynthesis protein